MTTGGKNKVGRKSRGKQSVTLRSSGLELCVSLKSWCACNEWPAAKAKTVAAGCDTGLRLPRLAQRAATKRLNSRSRWLHQFRLVVKDPVHAVASPKAQKDAGPKQPIFNPASGIQKASTLVWNL
jgi:hypothetical protein